MRIFPKMSHDWELVARCKQCGFLVRLSLPVTQTGVWANRVGDMPKHEGEVVECSHSASAGGVCETSTPSRSQRVTTRRKTSVKTESHLRSVS